MAAIRKLLRGELKPGQIAIAATAPAEDDALTLGRAERAFKDHTCVVLTAFRGGYSLEQNKARNQLLRADLEQYGFIFNGVTGCYREADWEYACEEYCFFVTNEGQADAKQFFTRIYRLSEKYDQDSFLYKKGGISRTAFLVASTDAGRADLKRDIRYAGQLFIHVPDQGAWTACRDGRFAFQLRGMILTGTQDKKIRLGEGDLFDVKSYGADGLVVLRRSEDDDLGQACKRYNGKVPLVQHVFKKEPTQERLHEVLFRCLKQLRDQRCKVYGFLCNVPVSGSTVEGASCVYEAIKSWAHRYDKKFKWIVIVDTYGDYNKVVNDKK
ncbi:MAG: hypothetical protein J5548_08915 [Prevotella sp.]|nr:hypothetical protein [Prevotella sp.]